MPALLCFVSFLVIFSGANGQCLTEFSKLEPEPSIDFASGFGDAISMHDDYLAVGIRFDDSLGRATGIVHIYRLIGGIWKRKAAMAPSNPGDGLQFGTTVKLSADYLLVGAPGGQGQVYVFKKPVSGWTSDTEIVRYSYPGATYFGVQSNKALTISSDQQTIAITDEFYRTASMPSSRSGGIFIYHRTALEEWSSAITPAVLTSPEDDCQDFGEAGVSLFGDRLVTATQYAPTGIGRVYVFKDLSTGFQNLTLEAKLDPAPAGIFDGFLFQPSITQTQEGIFVTGAHSVQTDPSYGILFYEAPASGPWIDCSSPTCFIDPVSFPGINKLAVNLSSNGTDLFTAARDGDGKGYMHIIRKGATDWCSPTYELIDQSPALSPSVINRYAQSSAFNQLGTTAAVGLLPHPENSNVLVALKAYHKPGSAWESELLYSPVKSTASHFFGADVLGFDDVMFVSAPRDGTVKPNGGAVYCYKKMAAGWQQINKILPPAGQQYDDVFGSALATNKTYLAVGAGHEPKGKIFIYKRTDSDWSSVDLVQEVTIPEAGLTVYSYGDNVAMDDEWLVVPYVQNSPARIMLALFKFNGATWDFSQVVEVGLANILSKESTISVAIENGIIVAGGQILELDVNGLWNIRYTLSPSDPEPIQISTDFTHWISNGSMFGFSVAIHENTIFIGAPARDHDGKWDVGAVYVYAKKPGEPWSSRTESIKLLPRLDDESQYFGYSVKGLFNTLIVGAPGADHDKFNNPRNLAGRAYIFRAEDYLWQTVVPLVDFTGESFEKDYYGIAVYMDETDFFIGASIEDIEGAKLSGAVYITPTPPIIKLEPPICAIGLVDLLGYPFVGTWTGPGIIDAAEGIFDAGLAGPGTKTFTYTTASCAYPGVLQLEVLPIPNAIIQTPLTHTVCTGSISKTITVQPQPLCSYRWYYRPSPSESFVVVGNNATSYTATLRGEYQVMVSNELCHQLSPITSIRDETPVSLELDPVGPTCNDKGTNIGLVAVPSGGQWSGPGVSGNSFNPHGMKAGNYTLTYTFTSVNGCHYQKQLITEVQTFSISMEPNGDSFDLCSGEKIALSFQDAGGDVYRWFRSLNNGDTPTELDEHTATLMVDQTGYYSARVTRGQCEVEVVAKYVLIYESDTLFVPNVFTPNGDGSNEFFEVVTNQDVVSVGIFDRKGELVFESDRHTPWNGGNASAGVYYWQIKYLDCKKEKRTANGWVQLIR